MNKERRKRLGEAVDLLEQAKSIVEECKDEEQEYHDNIPESFQNGEKGETAQQNVDNLETAESFMDCIIDDLNGVCEKIDEAIDSVEDGQS